MPRGFLLFLQGHFKPGQLAEAVFTQVENDPAEGRMDPAVLVPPPVPANGSAPGGWAEGEPGPKPHRRRIVVSHVVGPHRFPVPLRGDELQAINAAVLNMTLVPESGEGVLQIGSRRILGGILRDRSGSTALSSFHSGHRSETAARRVSAPGAVKKRLL